MVRLFRIIDSSDPERKLSAARVSFRLVIKDSDRYLFCRAAVHTI